MFRRAKTLILALTAVLVLSALTASAASAISVHSTASESELSSSVEEVNGFVVDTGVVVCEVAHFTGSQGSSTSESIVLQPSYTECEFEELFSVTVSTNGCDYVLTPTEESEVEGEFDGSFGIEGCNEATPYIQIGSLATCRVRIAEQGAGIFGKLLKAIVKAGKKAVKWVRHKVSTAIDYVQSGLFCAGKSSNNNGSLIGTADIVANELASELWIE